MHSTRKEGYVRAIPTTYVHQNARHRLASARIKAIKYVLKRDCKIVGFLLRYEHLIFRVNTYNYLTFNYSTRAFIYRQRNLNKLNTIWSITSSLWFYVRLIFNAKSLNLFIWYHDSKKLQYAVGNVIKTQYRHTHIIHCSENIQEVSSI